jgi:hypothetical protein
MTQKDKPGEKNRIAFAQSQAPGAQAGAGTGSVLVVPGAAAMITQPLPSAATSGQAESSLPVRLNIEGVTSIKVAGDKKPNAAKHKTSVALQQGSQTGGLNPAPAAMFQAVDYSKHTDDQLHQATVAALATYTQRRGDADAYAYDVLIPALNEIIVRYKQPGRATPYRLTNCPTVQAYFDSIGLNYATVRTWKLRSQKRLLQAAADAGTKPVPKRRPDPIPRLNKAARRALIDGNHKAVELVVALEAGRDVKKEIAEFKSIMNAKRLDDILQVDEEEPDYKGILAKVLRTVKEMKSVLPAQFVETVGELTKGAKPGAAMAPAPSRAVGNVRPAGRADKGPVHKVTKPAKASSAPQARRLKQPSLTPGKKYTVRAAASGGYGIYEVGSPVIIQNYSTSDAAWAAIEALETAPPSVQEGEPTTEDTGVLHE